MTSIVGSSPSNITRAVVCRPISRMRSTTKPASATTSRTLPSSDGCRLKPGSSIQLRAPRVAGASSEHADDRHHQHAVDRVPQLAQARVVQARDAVHQDEPDDRVDGLALDVVQRVAGLPSAVALCSATSEQATSPSVASSSSGSRRRRHSRGTSGGGGSEAGWIGRALNCSGPSRLGTRRRLNRTTHEDEARRGCRSFRTEAAALDGHDDHDRLAAVLDEARVPRLIGVRLALGGAGLAVDLYSAASP